MQEKLFNKGDVIFRQGDTGDSFYRIEKGSVEVIAKGEGEEEKKLTELSTGDFFGEMAVLEAYPRSATVIALEDETKVVEIPGNKIDEYFAEDPEKIIEVFRFLSKRLRSLTDDYQEATAVYEEMNRKEGEKSEGLLSRIGKVLGGLFGTNRKEQISAETLKIIEGTDLTKGYSGETAKYKAGTIIFREGEASRCMYAVHWGEVGIYTAYGTPEEKQITKLVSGQFFGEMGIVENLPRSATAVALTDDTTLETITVDGLKDMFGKNPPKVDMIIRNLSYRLRRLTNEYTDLCAKIDKGRGA